MSLPEICESGVVLMLRQDVKFEEFWNLYPSPRRLGKAMAHAKWDAITGPTGLHARVRDDSHNYTNLMLIATPMEIIEGLKRACMRWRNPVKGIQEWRDGGKYIPLPSTFLNQGRWLD